MSDWQTDVVEPVERLLDRWTAEDNRTALDELLPGWRANNGLRVGWFDALAALQAAARSDAVPANDAAVLLAVADRVQHVLSNR